MGRVRAFLLILSLFFFFSPLNTDASDVSLEESIQHNLQKAKTVIKKAQGKLKSGSPITVYKTWWSVNKTRAINLP